MSQLETGEVAEETWLWLDRHAFRVPRSISSDDRLDQELSLFVILCRPYPEFMSTVAFDLEQLGVDLDRRGFASRQSAVRQLVHLARAYGVGGAAVDVLADPSAPEVARMRAFAIVAAALLPVTGDRIAAPLVAA